MRIGKQVKVITVVPNKAPRTVPIKAPGWPVEKPVAAPNWPVKAPAEVER
mgnify:FL=1